MLNLNPLTTLSYFGRSAVSVGAHKLREHFNQTTAHVRDQATAQNIAYASMAASAVGCVMINPTTRVALCTFLGFSYTMATMTFNLVMIGLYAAWMGMNGISTVGSIGTALAPMLGTLGKGFLGAASGLVATTVSAAPAAAAPVADVVPDIFDRALAALDEIELPVEMPAAPLSVELGEIFNSQAVVDALGENVDVADVAGFAAMAPGEVEELEQIFANQASAAVLQEAPAAAGRSIPVAKYVGCAIAVGVGTFAAYQVYKQVREHQELVKKAEAQPKTSYAAIDADALEADYGLSDPFFGNIR